MTATATETVKTIDEQEPMSTPADQLIIEYQRPKQGKTTTLTAKIGNEVLHVESLDLTKSTSRKRFAEVVCKERSGIDRKTVDEELLRIAADLAGDRDGRDDQTHSVDAADLPELDTSRIVRPERFITPGVSGLAVPTMIAVGDKPTGQWLLYLQWCDGRREVKRLSQCIELPGDDSTTDRNAHRLWVHPMPAKPTVNQRSGWLELAERDDVCPAMSGRDYELWHPLLSLAAWIESYGAQGLLGLMQDHARTAIDESRDDATPDHDETLLRVLTDAVRIGDTPTAGEILDAANQREPRMYEKWSARAVGGHLKRYGLTTNKTGGRLIYGRVTLDDLLRIQTTYNVDLGFDDEPINPNADNVPYVPYRP